MNENQNEKTSHRIPRFVLLGLLLLPAGIGLGLSLAYDIVTTGHGGAIELNTEPGEGTEFVIYIPMKKK